MESIEEQRAECPASVSRRGPLTSCLVTLPHYIIASSPVVRRLVAQVQSGLYLWPIISQTSGFHDDLAILHLSFGVCNQHDWRPVKPQGAVLVVAFTPPWRLTALEEVQLWNALQGTSGKASNCSS